MIRYTIVFALSFCLRAAAQDERSVSEIPRHVVRFSPFHLINFYPTLQLGYERRLKGRFTLYTEGGYVVNWQNGDPRFADKRGFKAKIEPRYYAYVGREGKFLHYYAVEFYYNHVNFDRTHVQTECFDPECIHLFRRSYFYKVTYREEGVGLKSGIQLNGRRFSFDINAGFAIRFVDYDSPSIPRAFNLGEFDGWLNIPNEEDRVAWMPLLGLRVGYQIR